MNNLELAAVILMGAVMTLLATTAFRDWLRKRRLVASLAARVQRDDEQLGRFFGDPKRADVAVRLRRLLSKNLEMPLGGLAPSDRLKEDLNAELPRNPHLFWDLEEEFGIKSGMEDLESFEKTLEQLVTFQDLVEFVGRRISEAPAETPSENEDEKPSRAYEFAIRSIPILCVGGFLILAAGSVLDKNWIQNLGIIIFASGIAIWGFANGGELLGTMIQQFRVMSLKEIAARRWNLIFLTCLVVFFLSVGIFSCWAVLKKVFK